MVTLDLFFTCLDEPPEEPIPPAVPDAEEEEPARQQEAVQEEHVAKPEPESSHAKEKKIERTGDSPGEMESLGDQPDSSGQEMKPAKQDDTIIEEILDK
ncbi:MAG: hypothetical protein HY885_10585 [Deltaproteobacteria bacterium]|nr:hypothetical protein [Deltaproteobacteria bacterium]